MTATNLREGVLIPAWRLPQQPGDGYIERLVLIFRVTLHFDVDATAFEQALGDPNIFMTLQK